MTIPRLAWLPALVLSLLSSSACAYVQYFASDDKTPLRWFVYQTDVYFDDDAPADIAAATARAAVQNSYKLWSSLLCDGTATPFSFDFVGTRSCSVGYDIADGATNESCVIWVSDHRAWTHGSTVLALTSLTFNDVTGEIIDADLEFNDAEFEFTTGKCIGSKIDLCNTATHEAGHVLGLDHSKHADSTMYSKAPPCETKKCDLHTDDVSGFCSLYGPNAPPKPVVTEPATSAPACSAAPTAGPGSGAWWWVLLLGLLAPPGFRYASPATCPGR